MRPRGVYVIFNEGRATHIVEGYTEARRHTRHRAYKRFPPKERTAAEEFAAWHNFRRDQADARIMSTKG